MADFHGKCTSEHILMDKSRCEISQAEPDANTYEPIDLSITVSNQQQQQQQQEQQQQQQGVELDLYKQQASEENPEQNNAGASQENKELQEIEKTPEHEMPQQNINLASAETAAGAVATASSHSSADTDHKLLLASSMAEQNSRPKEAQESTAAVRPFCRLCSVQCSSLHNYMDHLAGQKHKKAAEFAGVIEDEIAKPDFVPVAASGLQHALQKTKEKPATESASSKSLRCEICDIEVTGAQNLKAHYVGQKHRKALNKQQQQQQQSEQLIDKTCLRCDICNKDFASARPLTDHLAGKKHGARLRELDAMRSLQNSGHFGDKRKRPQDDNDDDASVSKSVKLTD